MARILLGVSGGIAAYKSLELARLATVAGHGVRVAMTENAERFVGPASFEGIVGAPVLRSEFERDPLGGAFPGEPRPGHDPIGHLEVAANCDAYLIAPASANTIAKLAAGSRRLDADHLLPRLCRAAPGRAGDERPHVRRRGDPGEPGDAARARRRDDRAGRGQARLARRVRPRPPARPGRAAGPDRSRAARRRAPVGRDAGAGHRGWDARAARPGALPRQPLQRAHGYRPRRRRRPPRRRGHPDRRQRRHCPSRPACAA